MTENEKMIEAAKKGDLEAVKAAIAAGADDLNTAMRVAGCSKYEIIDFLKKKGADGNNWMLAAVASSFSGKWYKHMVDVAIEYGADDFEWALLEASKIGHMQGVEFMLEKGAANYDECIAEAEKHNMAEAAALINDYRKGVRVPHEKTQNEKLLEAARNGDTEGVAAAIQSGADNTERAIRIAVRAGHLETTRVLAEEGDYDYWQVLEMAANTGRMDIARILKAKGSFDYDIAMGNAAKEGYVDVVELMLEKGAKNLNDAMITAAWCGKLNTMKLLIEKGADDYNEALAFAAISGNREMVEFLFEKGANDYNEAIKEAVSKGHKDIVNIMIEKGADINIIDDFGNNPLYNAALYGHVEIVKLLLEKGADGYDAAIKTAVKHKFVDVVSLITEFRDNKK